MLNVTNHQRNANFKENEILPQPVRMAIINKQLAFARRWGKENPLALLVGMQIGKVTMENNMEGPQKIKNHL